MRKFNLIEVLIEFENTPKGVCRSFRNDVSIGDYLVLSTDVFGDILNVRYDSQGKEYDEYMQWITDWFCIETEWYEQ